MNTSVPQNKFLLILRKYKSLIIFLNFFILCLLIFQYLFHQQIGSDFSVFYLAEKAFLNRENIYGVYFAHNLFLYPPSFFIFFLPFTSFRLSNAFLYFDILSIGLYVLTFFFITKNQRFFSWFILPLFLLSNPFRTTLSLGQVNVFALFFLFVVFYLSSQRGKYAKILAGIFLCVAAGFKLLSGIAIIYFLTKKQWVSGVVFIIFFFLLNILLLHNGKLYLLQYVGQIHLFNKENVIGDHSLYALLLSIMPEKIDFIVCLFAFISLTIFIIRQYKNLNDKSSNLLFLSSLLIISNYFSFGYSWNHHEIFILPLLLWLFVSAIETNRTLFIWLFTVGYIVTQFDFSGFFFVFHINQQGSIGMNILTLLFMLFILIFLPLRKIKNSVSV